VKEDEDAKFMTLAEPAEELRVTRRFVSNLAARGELPAYKIGRLVRWDRWRLTGGSILTGNPFGCPCGKCLLLVWMNKKPEGTADNEG
jgi:excisionase family DNA binding protein